MFIKEKFPCLEYSDMQISDEKPPIYEVRENYSIEEADQLYEAKIRQLWRLQGYLEQLRMLIMFKKKEEKNGKAQTQMYP